MATAAIPFYLNIYNWIFFGLFMFILVIVLFIILILLKKWTHAFVEFKARIKGVPLSIFFFDSKTADWATLKPEAGMIQHKDYGTFIINERGSYIDKKTRNVLMCFDGGFGSGADIKNFKLSQDLANALKDEQKMSLVREALINGNIEDEDKLTGLKESINFSHLRSLANTLLPHNITSYIEKIVAQRMANYGKINILQIILIAVAIIGCTAIAIILLKMYG